MEEIFFFFESSSVDDQKRNGLRPARNHLKPFCRKSMVPFLKTPRFSIENLSHLKFNLSCSCHRPVLASLPEFREATFFANSILWHDTHPWDETYGTFPQTAWIISSLKTINLTLGEPKFLMQISIYNSITLAFTSNPATRTSLLTTDTFLQWPSSFPKTSPPKRLPNWRDSTGKP